MTLKMNTANARVVAKNEGYKAAIEKMLKANGFKLDSLRPDIVFSAGGDGTYLIAENKFPGVPKVFIRDSSICRKCDKSGLKDILEKLKSGDVCIEPNIKIKAKFKGRCFSAANDIIFRNDDLTQAVRFTVSVNGRQINRIFIGDGLVVSTPFGSTAYFYSITRKKFRHGIGIAFNNITSGHKPIVVDEDSEIKITLVRNNAQLAFDNTKHPVLLKEGDSVIITKDSKKAKIVKVKCGFFGLLRKLGDLRYFGRRMSVY